MAWCRRACTATCLLSEGSGPGARHLSLDELAEAVSRSPFHLRAGFRQQTGLACTSTASTCGWRRRWSGCPTASATSGLAHDLGYCSQSHLGAVFRRAVGVTLGDARRVLGPAGAGARI